MAGVTKPFVPGIAVDRNGESHRGVLRITMEGVEWTWAIGAHENRPAGEILADL